jgi:phosphoribosylglycinamide formyltransferase 1
MTKIKMAVFASGSGSNALKIIDYYAAHATIEVGFLLTNNANAPIVQLAEKRRVTVCSLTNEQVAEGVFLTNLCRDRGVDYIILAGYLRKIPEELIKEYRDKIINIHPALLPKFGGKGMYGKFVHEAVIKAGEKETGITIHLVNENYDEGRILAQFYCAVEQWDTVEKIQSKIQRLEHVYFAYVIDQTITEG